MAFHLTKASCVTIGSFNIYIIQPAWLTSVGILSAGTEITIAANMNRPGFRLSSPQLKSVWFVAPGKLAIETKSATENCGAHMAQVLKKLPWTPVFALGNNIVFQGKREEVEPFPAVESCGDVAVVPDGFSERHRLFAISVDRGGREFTLQVSVGPDSIELSGNVHVSLPVGGTAEQAVEFAERFEADGRELASLFTDVLGVRLNVTSHP